MKLSSAIDACVDISMSYLVVDLPCTMVLAISSLLHVVAITYHAVHRFGVSLDHVRHAKCEIQFVYSPARGTKGRVAAGAQCKREGSKHSCPSRHKS